MEMQTKTMSITTTGIVTEMLTLAVGALLSGLAAATIAGSLVIALTVVAK